MISLTACDQPPEKSNRNKVGADKKQHMHNRHEHGRIEVKYFGEATLIPSINFKINADNMEGWNIKIETNNFSFSPQHVNLAPSAGEGHAHIYVDGRKMARIYSNWYHLKKLTPGKHEVRISLNANNHSNWVHEGDVISATHIIIQN